MTETSSSRARRRADGRGEGGAGDDPFALLGLAAHSGLSDEDVRGAWRRIAAATHPDREDGGDPARFGAAAAAYVVLRTGFGRGEALADLGLSGATDRPARHAHRRSRSADPADHGTGRHRRGREAPVDRWRGARLPGLTRLRAWINRQVANWRPAGPRLRRPIRRPGGLALQVTGVAALALVAVVISGWSPGVIGVLAGALTWLLATAGRAFSRRRSQPPF